MQSTSLTSNIEEGLARLQKALANGPPFERCLRRWSEFIRERDGHRCVDCHTRRKLAAHHICRKSFLAEAAFLTGNGITLCRNCHREIHRGFNGRPNLLMPMDAQGGEKLADMERMYAVLSTDAKERGIQRDDFYFLSDNVLGIYKKLQRFEPAAIFPGSRVEQAYLIWAQSSLQRRNAIAEANGFPMTSEPILPGGAYIVFEAENREATESLVIEPDRGPVRVRRQCT